MVRAFLPFSFQASSAVHAVLGQDLDKVAVLALRAILAHGRSLEVAYQQIRYRKYDMAFSSRITASGNLVVELDLGHPGLGEYLVLEDEFRAATKQALSRPGSTGQGNRRRAG